MSTKVKKPLAIIEVCYWKRLLVNIFLRAKYTKLYSKLQSALLKYSGDDFSILHQNFQLDLELKIINTTLGFYSIFTATIV